MARDNNFGTGGGFVRSCKWSRFPRYHAWSAMCLIRVNASHAADDFPRRCLEQFASRTHSARGRVKRSDSLLLARQKSYRRCIARETLRALGVYAAIYRGTKKMRAFCGTWNIGRGNMETGGKTRYSRAKSENIAVAIGNARFNAANRINWQVDEVLRR